MKRERERREGVGGLAGGKVFTAKTTTLGERRLQEKPKSFFFSFHSTDDVKVFLFSLKQREANRTHKHDECTNFRRSDMRLLKKMYNNNTPKKKFNPATFFLYTKTLNSPARRLEISSTRTLYVKKKKSWRFFSFFSERCESQRRAPAHKSTYEKNFLIFLLVPASSALISSR